MTTDFKKGRKGMGVYGATNLSDGEKQQLCMELLHEFGAQNIEVRGDEIHHSCCLPFGLHANGDRHPSASLNWRKLCYGCFGCGSNGGLFWFVSVCRGETQGEVRDWITHRNELDGEDGLQSLLSYLDELYAPGLPVGDVPIPHFNVSVLDPWKKIHPYLTEMRGIPVENIKRHLVGFDPKSNRIIIPHFWESSLVGWQSRRLVSDGTPKYLNTPDFPKDQTVFGTETDGPTVIVEAPMTVIAKSHLPYSWRATFGATVTDRQKMLIAESPRVIVWFDNDQAGWTATEQVADSLLSYSDVFVVESPWNEDAGGLDDQTVVDLLAHPVPYPLWHPPEKIKEWQP